MDFSRVTDSLLRIFLINFLPFLRYVSAFSFFLIDDTGSMKGSFVEKSKEAYKSVLFEIEGRKMINVSSLKERYYNLNEMTRWNSFLSRFVHGFLFSKHRSVNLVSNGSPPKRIVWAAIS